MRFGTLTFVPFTQACSRCRFGWWFTDSAATLMSVMNAAASAYEAKAKSAVR